MYWRSLGIGIKILDDPDGFIKVFMRNGLLQLKYIKLFADSHKILNIIFRNILAVHQVQHQFINLIVDAAKVIAYMVNEQVQGLY